MSRWLALVQDGEKEIETPPDIRTKPDKTSCDQPEAVFCRVLSNCQVSAENRKQPLKEAKETSPQHQILKFEQRPISGIPADCRHGIAPGGRPKTWTGKIVSLADWRRFSDWEKHGPDGRHWNGKTRQWEADKR